VRAYSLDAFVIRLRPLGESDRIVTLFSRERGKVDAVAKGARRTASRFGARLDFFVRSKVEIHAGRSLDVITGAQIVRGAWERLVDPDAYAMSSYAAEMIDGLCEPDLAVPEVFELLEELQQTLVDLDAGSLRAASASLRPAFDVRLLAALGFALELDGCARCGAALGRRPFAGGRAMLSPEAGGLVCRACLDAGGADHDDVRRDLEVVRISAREFELLRRARSSSLSECARVGEIGALAAATSAFVQHHLGRRSRVLASMDAATGRERRDRSPRRARRAARNG
jgi:DNA repair protein RecO (recombination protein O)